MRLLLTIAFGLLCSIAANAAPTSPCVRYPAGKVPATHVLPLCVATKAPEITPLERVIAIRKTLPVPSDWHIFLESETEWNKQKLGTNTAYSNLTYKSTFIRESYVITAAEERLRRTIAHEMGHRICNCTDEGTADKIADQLIRDSH